MTVYAFNPAKLKEQLSDEKIATYRYKPEGQITLANGQLVSIFEERSAKGSMPANFVACTQDTMKAVVDHLDWVIKKRPRSEATRTRKQRAANIRVAFLEEAEVLQEAVSAGKPVVETLLEQNLVSLLAKNLG